MNIFSNLFAAKKESETKQTNTFIQQLEKAPLIQDNDISPTNISWAITMKNDYDKLGDLNQLYRKFLENDDNLGSAVDVRTEALKSTKPRIADDIQYHDELQALADLLWSDLCELTIEKKLFGFLFRQRIWNQNDDLTLIPDRYKFYSRVDLRVSNDTLVYYDEDQIKSLPELKFIMQYHNKNILQSLLKYYCFFSFCLNNWARFTETYGKPIRVGKYEPGTPKTEKDALWNMIKSAGTDMSAMISKNTVLEFVDFANKSASKDIYEALVKFTETRVTRRVLGQTLTTTAEKTGSYAQSKIHDLVRKDILTGDIRDLKIIAQNELNLIAFINYGIAHVPFTIDSPSTINLNERIKIDVQAANQIEIPSDYWYDTYGYPRPEKPASPSKVPIMQNSWELQAPARSFILPSARAKNDFDLKPITKEATKLTNQIKKLNSLEDLNDLPFPTNLYLTFGTELHAQILQTYIKARLDHTPASASASPLRPLSPLRPQNFNIDDILEFSWTMDDLEAMNAFRSEAFIVAGVTVSNNMQQLKDSAAQAVKDGIPFTQWRETAALNGFQPDNPYYLRTNFNTAPLIIPWLLLNGKTSRRIKTFYPTCSIMPFLMTKPAMITLPCTARSHR